MSSPDVSALPPPSLTNQGDLSQCGSGKAIPSVANRNEGEKQVSAEVIVIGDLATAAKGEIPNVKIPAVKSKIPSQSLVGSTWAQTSARSADGGGKTRVNTSCKRNGSSHSQHQPALTEEQLEASRNGEPWDYEPDHRVTIRRSYGGFRSHRFNRELATRGSRGRGRKGDGSSKDKPIPRGRGSTTRGASNLRASKRSPTNDAFQEGGSEEI